MLVRSPALLLSVAAQESTPKPRSMFLQVLMKLINRSWGLSIAFLSLLAGQEVGTAALHRTLHGEQEAVTVKDGALKSTDGKVYFSVREWPAPHYLLSHHDVAAVNPPSC